MLFRSFEESLLAEADDFAVDSFEEVFVSLPHAQIDIVIITVKRLIIIFFIIIKIFFNMLFV